MTTARDIVIYQGQAFALSLPYAGTSGRGQRMHIRTATATATVVQILTYNGDANARVLFDGTDAIDITIGASFSGLWLVGSDRVEWVYDIEDYSLADDDDVVITHRGKCVVYGNRTRAEDVTPSAQMPSGDGRYVRFDGEQTLTTEQKLQARENIGAGSGGSGSGDVVGPSSSTDDRIAAFDGTTGKLIKQGSVTATAVASHLSSTSNPHGVTAAQVGADAAGTAATAVGALAATLGTAATKDVGTTAGTVAAGDDSRITGAVQTSRTVSAAGLATGGGDLSANRTITVPAAVASDVDAGTSTSVAMTPDSYRDSTPYYVDRTADWTLAQADANTEQQFNSSGARVCTIDTNANAAISTQTIIPLLRLGSGSATIDAVAGVTLNGVDGASKVISTQYQGALLRKVGADAWVISGDIA